MSRDELLYLEDIAEACRKVLSFTAGMTKESFEADERTYDAVIRNLEVAGEAAKHVSASLREQLPDLEWRKLAGLRDVLAHAYFGIDNDILWDVIAHKVSQVAAAVEDYLNRSSSRPGS